MLKKENLNKLTECDKMYEINVYILLILVYNKIKFIYIICLLFIQ